MTTRQPRRRPLILAVAITLTMALSGCGAAAGIGATQRTGGSGTDADAAGYWTRTRLLNAQPWRTWALPRIPDAAPGATPSAGPTYLAAPRVGAIFSHDRNGNHFCTASVVASPHGDLLITAAHCIHGGKGGGYKSDIVFIPGYRDGTAPFGVWTPSRLIVDQRWIDSSDPDLDVGFVVLRRSDGRSIQDVLGANKIGFDAGFTSLVRVTGYPQSAGAPVTCRNWTARQSDTQLRFECTGFYGGTSGSPWVTDFNPQTHEGTIVGVIGGYQEGGETDSLSYSPYFGNAIRRLYDHAVAAG